jgi:hypothetical protein
LVRVLLLVFASVMLYYGLSMLLLVPHAPGESYWAAERFRYGFAAAASGLCIGDHLRAGGCPEFRG